METKYNLPKWLVVLLAGALAAFVVLLVVEKIYTVAKTISPKKPENTISISAEGKVAAVPDLAVINVGVLTTGSTAKFVEDESSKKINQIIDFVKKQGVDKKDIATSQFSIYPTYDYREGTNKITGYQANQTVTVKVRGIENSTEKVSNILVGATNNGANEIGGVYFTFDDADNLRQQARKQAIAKAKEKAVELAAEAGLRLGKVVSISEGSYATPIPMMYEKGMAAPDLGGRGGAPQVEQGSQDITASITVVFEIK
ncbi:MAG: SIMPL domain-containing protein [Candidatus Doudnabacteria bacterium]|nr:SIMPL domain-containing protein [Candidatus Doudnabacteria bacterium]